MALARPADALLKTAAPLLKDRAVRWIGGFIVVYTSGEWEFYRCCRCHRRLSDRASRDRGYGSECKKLADIAEIVEAERTRDRIRLRFDLARSRYRRG